MTRRRRHILSLLLLACLLASTPASSQEATAVPDTPTEPSEQQLRDAYAAKVDNINFRTSKQFDAPEAAKLTLQLQSLKKLRCEGMARAGVHFDCRVELRLRQGRRTPKTTIVQIWFALENGDWVAH